MQYRKIGNSDLELSVITFGAWAAGGWMWGGNEDKDAIEAIQVSYDLGVTSIDTAPAYGQGHSEEVVGEAIKSLPRDKVQLLTKYGLRWDLAKGTFYFHSKTNEGKEINIYKYAGKESIMEECEKSLRRLGTDYIDLYQIHWPDVVTPVGETMEAVNRLIEQGKVRHAGVCNYNAELLEEAKKHIPLVSDQIPFSMIRRENEKETIPYCLQHGLSILAYSPLERAILTGKVKPGHHFAEGDHRKNLYYFKDENINSVNAFLDRIRPLAAEKNATLSQLVLRWTVEQPGVTIALTGARNKKQAMENAAAAGVSLTPEEREFITTELDKLRLVKDV
jgi:aryl-alcohol dehydrogenase-like predicted oxidoreductase